MLSFCCKKYITCFQLKTLKFVHTFQSVVLYSTSTSTDEATQSISSYLVNSLGFSHQQAVLTCTKLPIKKVNDLKFRNNADSAVDFLKKHGFNDAHVRKIVSLYPRILYTNVDKTLEPKFKLLRDEGFSGSDLVRVFSANPMFVAKHLNHVIPNLRAVLGSDVNLMKLLVKSNIFITPSSLDKLVTNAALLKYDYGVDIKVIWKTIVRQPSSFLRHPKFFRDVLVRVEEELGIPRDSKMFLYGANLLSCFSNKSIESKCQVFKSFGWTDDNVSDLMVRSPSAFLFSEANISKKLGFLMNEIGYDPGFLASHSAMFTCSLEKRMLPRYGVLRVLKEKDLLDYNFYTAILKKEDDFLRIVVKPFQEVVPGLLEFYQKSKGCPNIKPLPTVMPSLVAAK